MSSPHEVARVPWTPALVRVMAALMVSLFVAAMDSTVVGTALPTIARELGSFELYPWVVAGYLITGTTTVPLWGRLADIRGRKPVLLAGLAIFVIASALCAWSPSMLWLIAFRTLQGIGAGCIQPLVFTTVGDIFPLAQRARLQGFFASMWAIAAIVGPALGALFVSTIGWRWIFTINIPIGIATAFFATRLIERDQGIGFDQGADIPGAVLITSSLMLGVYTIVKPAADDGWGAPMTLGLGAASLALLAAFVAREATARTPLVPLRIFRNRNVSGANVIQALFVAGIFGMFFLGSLYMERVLGYDPLEIGLAFLPVALGIGILSLGFSERLVMRFGAKPTLLVGLVLIVAGLVLFALSPVHSSYLGDLLAPMLLFGVGAGFSFPSGHAALSTAFATLMALRALFDTRAPFGLMLAVLLM